MSDHWSCKVWEIYILQGFAEETFGDHFAYRVLHF